MSRENAKVSGLDPVRVMVHQTEDGRWNGVWRVEGPTACFRKYTFIGTWPHAFVGILLCFLAMRAEFRCDRDHMPVKLKMCAAYKMGSQDDTICGGWNKERTWKVMA